MAKLDIEIYRWSIFHAKAGVELWDDVTEELGWWDGGDSDDWIEMLEALKGRAEPTLVAYKENNLFAVSIYGLSPFYLSQDVKQFLAKYYAATDEEQDRLYHETLISDEVTPLRWHYFWGPVGSCRYMIRFDLVLDSAEVAIVFCDTFQDMLKVIGSGRLFPIEGA